MKILERILLILAAALVLAGLGVGLSALFRHRGEGTQAITQRDRAQAAAADPNGPQMSLWRADPGRSVMLFGKAVKTGAFMLPESAAMTLRTLVLERGGGFAPDAQGKVHIARKVEGKIANVVEATRAQLADPAWKDVPLEPGDVVYAE